jgi:hypothetical protein
MKLNNFAVPIAVLTAAGVVHPIPSRLAPTPFRSFVVTSVMSSPRAGSPYLHTTTITHAVRSDGSWAKIETAYFNGREYSDRVIHDYEAGKFIIVEDQTRSIVVETISEDEYRNRLAAATSCDGDPAGKILGLDVNYFEDTYQITNNPQGVATAVIKEWRAADLGCFVLQKETIWIRNSDGVLLVDTKITPIDIQFQPVDQYFQLPTDYTERTREQARDLLEKSLAN